MAAKRTHVMRPPTATLSRTGLFSVLSGGRNYTAAFPLSRSATFCLGPASPQQSTGRSCSTLSIVNALPSNKAYRPILYPQRPSCPRSTSRILYQTGTRFLSTTRDTAEKGPIKDAAETEAAKDITESNSNETEGFGRSEKASRAAQVNLSARLRKEGSAPNGKAGAGEIVRLLKIARPEAKWLGGNVYS